MLNPIASFVQSIAPVLFTTPAPGGTAPGTAGGVDEGVAAGIRTTGNALGRPLSDALSGLATLAVQDAPAGAFAPAVLAAVTAGVSALEGPSADVGLVSALSRPMYSVTGSGTLPPGADAAYNETSGRIELPSELVARGLASSSRLLGSQLLDAVLGDSGKTLAGTAEADRAADHHELATSLALVAHETVHAEAAAQQSPASGHQVLRPDGSVDPAILREHVRMTELPAQRVQELAQLRWGEPSATSPPATIDAAGAPLPDDQAVENIIRQRGDSIVAGLVADSDPGKRFPGKRFPGQL